MKPEARSWRGLVPLILAALLIAPFLHDTYHRVSGPYYFRRLTSEPWMLWLHLWASGMALLVGWLNLLSGSGAGPGVWHRRLGWLYCAGVALGITGGLFLMPHVQHGGGLARFGLGYGLLLWAGCTAAMLVSARRRQLEQHRRWALRSYAISFSGITLRLLLESGLALKLPLTTVYATATCACFLLNLLVVEMLFVRRRCSVSGPRVRGGDRSAPNGPKRA